MAKMFEITITGDHAEVAGVGGWDVPQMPDCDLAAIIARRILQRDGIAKVEIADDGSIKMEVCG